MAEQGEREVASPEPAAAPREGVSLTIRSSTTSVLRFVGPIFGYSFLSFGFYFTDLLMIGPLGSVTIGAVGQGVMIYGVVLTFFFGLLSMYVPLLGNMPPEEREGRSLSALRTALLLAVGCAAILCAICSLAAPILELAGQPAETSAVAARYVSILRWAAFPSLLSYCLSQEANRRGRPYVGLIAAILGNLLNLLFDWLLIYDPLSLGISGIDGLALATVIARAMMVVCILSLLERGAPAERRLLRAADLRLDRAFLKAMLSRGLFRGLTNLNDWLAALILMLMIGWSGVNAMAGSQVADVIASASHMVPQAFCTLIGLVISRDIGDGASAGAIRQMLLRLLRITFAAVGVVSAVLLVLSRWIPIAFSLSPGTQAYDVSRTIIVIHLLFFPIYTLKLTLLAALDAMLDTKVPALAALVESYLLTIPLAYLVTRCGGGAPGVWIAEGTGMAALSILLVIRIHRKLRDSNARAAALEVP